MSPLIVEWDAASGTELSDVTGAGFGSDFVLTARAVEVLNRFGSWHPGPVEARTTPGSLRSDQLYDLVTDAEVAADAERSSIDVEYHCESCGTTTWKLNGGARTAWSGGPHGPTRTELPKREAGIVVPRAGDHDIFRVPQFPGWIIVTDRVRSAATEAGLTGVRLFEVGTALDRVATASRQKQ